MNNSIQKASNLIEEISNNFPSLTNEEVINMVLLIVNKILDEKPTYEYWSTYDDETPSAITLWSEVKSHLQQIVLKDNPSN